MMLQNFKYCSETREKGLSEWCATLESHWHTAAVEEAYRDLAETKPDTSYIR